MPAGRATAAQWLLLHHPVWSSAMSTTPRAEHVPLTPAVEKPAERSRLVPELWITRAVVFGLSLLAQPQLPAVPSPAHGSTGGPR